MAPAVRLWRVLLQPARPSRQAGHVAVHAVAPCRLGPEVTCKHVCPLPARLPPPRIGREVMLEFGVVKMIGNIVTQIIQGGLAWAGLGCCFTV